MKKSMYFKTKDDVLEYYGALENIPSTDLVIVEDTGSMYAVSNNASIDGEMTPTGGINWDEVAEYGYIVPVGTYNITENNNYDISSYAYAYVNVEGGGSAYTITSAYMTDDMNQKLDDFQLDNHVLSYEFSLDAAHSSNTVGVTATINNTYTAYFAPSLYISDPGNNGTFTQNGYINLSEWQSTGSVQIDSTLITNQPNIDVGVFMRVGDEPSLYGYPVEYEYVVRGYTAVEKITVQYLDMNTSMWNDSIELVDDGNGVFEGDFWPASGYPIRFLSSVSGEMFADLQQDTTISSDWSSIDLVFSSKYELYFDINGSCHIVIGKDSNGYKLNELTKNEYVEIRNDNNVFQLYENNNFIINLASGTLEFTDKDNNTLNIATVIDPNQNPLSSSTIDLDVPGVYTLQVSDTQGSDASLTLQNWTNKNITVGNLVLPASDDSDKIWSIDITVGGV